MTENKPDDFEDKRDTEELLPNGKERRIIVILNPKPNLHLNLGKH